MDRQTTFLLALGMLVAAALAVGTSGWILFIRDRAVARAAATSSAGSQDDHHHEAVEEH